MEFINFTGNANLLSAHVADPVFFDPAGHLLIECDQPSAHRLIAHYSYRLVQSPRCLIDHVRLILLLRTHGSAERLAQAFINLFEVLGDAGRDLRESLLRQCSDALDDEHQVMLQSLLDGVRTADNASLDFIEKVT